MDQPRPASSPTSNVVPRDQQTLMKSLADSWFTVKQDEWSKLLKANLMTVATLICSITFQAALNPPGGVVQTSTGENHNFTPIGCYRDPKGICTGDSVSAFRASYEYLYFINFNTFSFVAASSAALLLVNGMPLKHGFPMWLLSVIMSISLITLGLSYRYGVLLVTPDPVYYQQLRSLNIFLWVKIALSSFAVVFSTLRFFISFLREEKPSGSKN
ncbi:hypothetical protein L6164_031599 [Bauhinia variegata]|uniref:Uncharacterized protein n=1 Tax=Bauhinia variegata TaxID=167791 RepID=A0ACB9LFY5_BAUVA|nr:hypothetical protein L6164_031599 [Bauhinia variegata]